MHLEVLPPAQISVLAVLAPVIEDRSFYLAGGTALALRHGHRRSVDFDFFSASKFDPRRLANELDDAFGEFELGTADESTLYAYLQGITVSFFYYKYPLLEEPEPTEWGFGLASDVDLAAMKLEAITGRGTRKDFVDLRLLCRSGLDLDKIFQYFERKYGTRRSERYHRLRALDYFVQAEKDEMPDMLTPFDWEETKRFFTREATRILDELIEEGGKPPDNDILP